MNSYDSVTPTRRPVVRIILGTMIAVTIFGMSVSAAQSIDPSVVSAQASLAPVVQEVSSAPAPVQQAADGAPSVEVLELIAQIEERDHRIAVLEEQVAFVRQAQLTSEAASDGQVGLQAPGVLSDAEKDEAMSQWRAGYALGGGNNLSSFENVILPCESGNEPNPFTAVGPTDDWGRAQINRPTWKKRFESLTGEAFETHITDPVLNGFMAAHVEGEQGLSAWTCWRKR